MNSLMNYGSDDNSDDSGDDRIPDMPGHDITAPTKNYRKSGGQEDNYEEVGMDMSEDSNDSTQRAPNKRQTTEETTHKDRGGGKQRRSRDSSSSERRGGSRSPKNRKDDEEGNRRNRRSEDRHGRYDRERSDRGRDRDSRDDERGRDRRGTDDRRDYRRDERYSRDRRERDRKRSGSRDRDRRRSRSPRRSRSGSRGPPKSFRRDRASHRMDRLDKLGIPFKPDTYPSSALQGNGEGGSGDRFFMPGITGRFRDQIEKRKQLWQKGKEDPVVPVNVPGPSNGANNGAGSKAAKVYEATTFADDKTSSKFKRLMGIRETGGPANLPTKSSEVLKKQEEMFSSMEAQYEVARTATHTMRGVGLGFGSFQR